MGEDRSGAGPQGRLPPLKPPPDRLYGRARGHRLRARQQKLLDVTLPRLAFASELATDPLSAFSPRPLKLSVEVGAGSGEHALAQTAADADAGLIACEVFQNGICSLLSRLVPGGEEASAAVPGNLRLWADDARVLLRLLPDNSVDSLFLLFPDPWPKARHAKRRFVHPDQLPLLARVLKHGAEWRIASDDPTYQAWVDEVMAVQSQFDVLLSARERQPGWPTTRYETKALREGRTPQYWVLQRR